MQRNDIFIARKRSFGKVMFLHLSVILFTGGGVSVQGFFSRWVFAQGGFFVQGGLPPSPQYGGRASGRILLECILVTFIFKFQFQSGSFISITGYYGWLRLLTQGQLLTHQSTLYSPKPQPSLRQWKPFANNNETNANKSY